MALRTVIKRARGGDNERDPVRMGRSLGPGLAGGRSEAEVEAWSSDFRGRPRGFGLGLLVAAFVDGAVVAVVVAVEGEELARKKKGF